MHGKDITVPKGTEITAYINGNTPLDIAKFAPQSSPDSGTATEGRLKQCTGDFGQISLNSTRGR